MTDVERRSKELERRAEELQRTQADIDLARGDLALREAQLRQVLDLVPHFLFAKDWQGRFLLANRATAEAHGLTVEQITGARQTEIQEDGPELRDMLADDREVMRSGQPKHIPEESFTDANGEHRFLRTTKIPYTMLGSEELAVLGIAVDVTEQKRGRDIEKGRSTTLEMLAREDELDLVLGTMVDEVAAVLPNTMIALYLADPPGALTVRIVASARLPRSFHEAVDGAELDEDSGSCGRAIATGKRCVVVDVERSPLFCGFEELCKRTRIRSSWSQPIVLPNREVVGTFALYKSMPGEPCNYELDFMRSSANLAALAVQRVRAKETNDALEAQIGNAQKLESLGILAGGVAHDFNNLLVSILGNAGLALQDLPQASPSRKSIHEIEIAARRAGELSNQMLAYSGRGKFIIQSFRLQDLVEEMTQLLESSMSKKAQLERDFEPGLPPISGDVTQIRQVVMNLITNASDALGNDPGTIRISARRVQADAAYLADAYLDAELGVGEYVCFEVADNGCGMDADTQERLFDPFFTTKFTGRGLGMAAVLGIVRGHHGAIKVFSEPGLGTTFKLLFKACDQPAVPITLSTDVPEQWRGAGLVLIVDDEFSVRDLAARMLERVGFEILHASDGEEAVEVFRQRSSEITAVLLDMTMPKMNGDEAFMEIRKIQPAVPVLLMSGHDEEDTKRTLNDCLPSGFVRKPFGPDDLVNSLRVVLADQPQAT